MTPRKRLLIVCTILLLAALACDYLPAPAPAPDLASEDAIATSVAATVAAGEGDAPAPADSEATPDIPAAPELLRIVYVKDGDAWYWEEGGPHLALTAVGDVLSAHLSSDGQRVAFVRQFDWNNLEIHVVNSDGSNSHPLVTLADFAGLVTHPDAISAVPYRISWVPGTHTLAFNTRMTFEGPGLILPDELRLAEADTSSLSLLLAPGTAGDFYYSPDGSQIALVNGTSISVVNADGSNRRDLLTFPMVITYSEYIYYPPLVWSSDGTYLRASIPPHDPMAAPPEETTIWHLPADGSPASTLTTLSGATVPFFHSRVFLSPDGNKMAYLAMVTPGTSPVVDLHIANADGSGDVIYDSGNRSFDAWSTDGVHFIFSEGGFNPRIGRIGDPALSLTGIGQLVNVSWVDETRFLYTNLASGNWELWLREIGGPGLLITTGDNLGYDFIK